MNPQSDSPPRFPDAFPPSARSLRRDYGGEVSLDTDEPDAVLAGEELHLFGLETGWRVLLLPQVRSVRMRSQLVFGPWRLVAAMLVLIGLLAFSWLVELPGRWGFVLGVVTVVVSLLVLYLRKDTDRVAYRLEVLLELGGKLVLRFPEKVSGTAVLRFVLETRRRLRGEGGDSEGGAQEGEEPSAEPPSRRRHRR
jgi:hypothetical protein